LQKDADLAVAQPVRLVDGDVGQPGVVPILSATARAMMSLLPPGGSAITSVISLFG
jgi:hypothetical protein